MKVSIVMAYYNRRSLLINTLKTLYYSKHIPEVIIVDDGSDEDNRVEDLVEWPGLDIKVKRIEPSEKTWHNSCVPFNIGFKEATGDLIIIQCPECLHIGDVVDYAVKNVKDNKYIAFACYSADKDKCEIITKVDDYKQVTVDKILSPFVNGQPIADCQNGWYNHSKWNGCSHHFCSAIMKKDLDEKLNGGFDEVYAQGFAFEDAEFIRRIWERGFEVEICDSPYVVHQAHEPSDYVGKKELFERNKKLFYTGQI